MALTVTNVEEVQKLRIDDICEFMKTRPSSEIKEFQDYCSSINPNTQNHPTFFEIRGWFVKTYFPNALAKKEKISMLDKIMAL